MKPGDRIGPYRLIALLGRGGMGEVFAAVHERIGQAVAIKLLTACSPVAAARFIQEARALAQLEHPGVVRVLFLGETADGVPYMVLEQVLGHSLRELLRDHPAGLPPARALALLAQVAGAMAAVHRRGILHRDLKPDNILVVAGDGAADTVKVIDFGIARVPPPVLPGADTLIETGEQGAHWLGTVAYMAPEQCRRDSELGPPADVYALGRRAGGVRFGRLGRLWHRRLPTRLRLGWLLGEVEAAVGGVLAVLVDSLADVEACPW